MSCTSCAKEDEEPGRGGSRPSRYPKSIRTTSLRPTKIGVVGECSDGGRPTRDPKSMRATSLRPTKIEVVKELSDEKDHIASNFNMPTWGM